MRRFYAASFNPCEKARFFAQIIHYIYAPPRYNGGMKAGNFRYSVGKLLLALVLFYILGRAAAAPDMVPLGIGLYCALIYCGKNYFALSFAFFGGNALACGDLLSLIDGASALAVFGAVKLICRKFDLKLKAPAAVGAAFLSMLPRFFTALFVKGVAVQGVTSLVINTAFCAACCIGCFSVTVRKNVRFSYDELLSLCLILAAFGMGVHSLELWGYRPYFTVISALCLLSSAFPVLPGAGICAAFSLGAGICMRDMAAVGAALAVWAAAKCFRGQGKLPAALAGEGVYLLCGFVTGAFEPFDTLNICLAAAGMLAVLFIPDKAQKRLAKALFPEKSDALKYAVEKEREELFEKLGGCARLMMGMAAEFEDGGGGLDETEAACADVVSSVCAQCAERDKCPDIAGRDMFKKAVEKKMNGKEITADDFPVFVISKCGRLDKVMNACAASAQKALNIREKRAFALQSGAAAAEQMRSTGMVLGRLASKVGKSGGNDEETASAIIDALGYENVVCLGAAVLGEGEERRVILRLRKGDEEKSVVQKVVSRLMGAVKRIRCTPELGAVTLTYAPREKFAAAFGAAGAVKEGSDRPGDMYSAAALDGGRALIGLCDGMGSGSAAAAESAACLTMLENYCKCGFEKGAIPALINRFLTLRGGEKFCALDACVLDLNAGAAEFIKLGGVESFILSGGAVKTVEGGALPAGILDEITPVYRQVTLKDGDVLVMVSDGITDALTIHGAEYALTKLQAENPQRVADMLLAVARDNGLKDDATVLAVKLFAQEEER